VLEFVFLRSPSPGVINDLGLLGNKCRSGGASQRLFLSHQDTRHLNHLSRAVANMVSMNWAWRNLVSSSIPASFSLFNVILAIHIRGHAMMEFARHRIQTRVRNVTRWRNNASSLIGISGAIPLICSQNVQARLSSLCFLHGFCCGDVFNAIFGPKFWTAISCFISLVLLLIIRLRTKWQFTSVSVSFVSRFA